MNNEYFHNWSQLPLSQRMERFGHARENAIRTFRENQRALSTVKPKSPYEEMLEEKERRADARLRASRRNRTLDPYTQPVSAYYAEREAPERNAGEEDRIRTLTNLMTSPDPLALFTLENMIKEIEISGPKED